MGYTNHAIGNPLLSGSFRGTAILLKSQRYAVPHEEPAGFKTMPWFYTPSPAGSSPHLFDVLQCAVRLFLSMHVFPFRGHTAQRIYKRSERLA